MMVLGLRKRKVMHKKTAFTVIAKSYQKTAFITGFNVINVLRVVSGSRAVIGQRQHKSGRSIGKASKPIGSLLPNTTAHPKRYSAK